MNFFNFVSTNDSRGLNAVIWAPVLFAILVMFLPKGEKGQIRAVTLIAMFVDCALAIWAFLRFQPGGPEFQLEYRIHWIDEIGVSYHTRRLASRLGCVIRPDTLRAKMAANQVD